jgi:hypothetical protein
MTGYRAWRLSGKSELRGLFYPYVWHPGPNISACDNWRNILPLGRDSRHEAPDEGCHCGFWLLESLEETISYLVWNDFNPSNYVIGQVRAWGKVIEHQLGNRAERAAVTGLVIWKSPDAERTHRLAERYDCPVLTYKMPEELPAPWKG